MPPRCPRLLLALGAGALACLPGGAAFAATAACTADDLCDASDDPCTVDDSYTVADGCSFDFGDRDVVFTGDARLDGDGGDFSLVAGALTLESGADLLSEGSSGATGGTITIELTGDLSSEGHISVNGAGDGGSISIDAGGSVLLDGSCLDAQGTSSDASGGEIWVQAGVDLETACTLDATSGSEGFGGGVELVAVGALVIGGNIDVDGGTMDGGGISLTGGTTVEIGAVDLGLSGGGDAGWGGWLEVSAGADLSTEASVRANGDAGLDGWGGEGGTLVLSAGGAMTVGGTLYANGASRDGSGGALEFGAVGDIVISGDLAASTSGSEGGGGSIDLSARGDLEVSGDLDVTGFDYGGGSVTLSAEGDLLLSGSVNADAGGEGDGGNIDLSSESGALTVEGSLVVTAGSGGYGGDITLQGCDVSIGPDAFLRADDLLGTNTITARETMSVEGRLHADSVNTLIYRETAPVIASTADIDPDETLSLDASLARCCEDADEDEVCDDEEDVDLDGYDGEATGGDDCDDADAAVHPGAEERWYDGVDNDCDPSTVDDDQDGDGWPLATDCDDEDAEFYPGAPGYGEDCLPLPDTGETGAETGGAETGAETGSGETGSGEETGQPDSGDSPGESGAPDSGPGADKGGCGCASSGGRSGVEAGLLSLLVLAGALRRRR